MCSESSPNIFHQNEILAFFEDNPALAQLEDTLLWQYDHLHYAKPAMTLDRYLETLNLVTALRTMRSVAGSLVSPALQQAAKREQRPIRCLEVDVRNWATVSGLCAALHVECGHRFELTGLEPAPRRQNRDGSQCGERALDYVRLEPQARFLCGNVMTFEQPMDLVVWWSPYLFPESAEAGGYPLSVFNPEAMLDHIIHQVLRPGGTLIIANQDILEFQTQADLLVPFNIRKQFAGPLPQPFVSLPYTRYGWLFYKGPISTN